MIPAHPPPSAPRIMLALLGFTALLRLFWKQSGLGLHLIGHSEEALWKWANLTRIASAIGTLATIGLSLIAMILGVPDWLFRALVCLLAAGLTTYAITAIVLISVLGKATREDSFRADNDSHHLPRAVRLARNQLSLGNAIMTIVLGLGLMLASIALNGLTLPLLILGFIVFSVGAILQANASKHVRDAQSFSP